jgi:hypothetical protein
LRDGVILVTTTYYHHDITKPRVILSGTT